jgi:hypothetical protein
LDPASFEQLAALLADQRRLTSGLRLGAYMARILECQVILGRAGGIPDQVEEVEEFRAMTFKVERRGDTLMAYALCMDQRLAECVQYGAVIWPAHCPMSAAIEAQPAHRVIKVWTTY